MKKLLVSAAIAAGISLSAAAPAHAVAYYVWVFTWQSTNPGSPSTVWTARNQLIGPISGTTLSQCQADAANIQAQAVQSNFLVTLAYCWPVT